MKTYVNILLSFILCILFLCPHLNLLAQQNDVQLYGFVHSLIVHEPPLIPVPNNETATPYWVNDIAQHTGNTFAFTGQFGQVPNHVDQLPPDTNIGFPGVASPWDVDQGETFGTSRINTILLTAANFIQWDLPSNPDPADPMGRTIVANTETLFDWTNNEIPNLRYYIYANWPEMDNAQAFPPTVPTQSEIDEFHDITMGNIGTFHDWWIQYQDALLVSRPSLQVRLIPVGRIISQVHTQIIPNEIPFDELYEDSDPHGRANTYFLAGLITYMALFEQSVPETYMPSSLIHEAIRNNLTAINQFIWQELNNFTLPNGASRVFYSNALSIDHMERLPEIKIIPNPVEDVFSIEFPSAEPYTLSLIDMYGKGIKTYDGLSTSDRIDLSNFSNGMYFLRFTNLNNELIGSVKLIKN